MRSMSMMLTKMLGSAETVAYEFAYDEFTVDEIACDDECV